jgi:hypothetical protein
MNLLQKIVWPRAVSDNPCDLDCREEDTKVYTAPLKFCCQRTCTVSPIVSYCVGVDQVRILLHGGTEFWECMSPMVHVDVESQLKRLYRSLVRFRI